MPRAIGIKGRFDKTEKIGTPEAEGKTPKKVKNKRERRDGSALTDNMAQSGVKRQNPTKAMVIKASESMSRSMARAKEIEQLFKKGISAAEIAPVKKQKAGAQPDPSGIGKKVILGGFAAAMIRNQILWVETPLNDRIRLIERDLNNALKLEGLPKLHYFQPVKKGGIWGSFSRTLWKISISEDIIRKPTLINDDAAQLCDTGMHESCHADQIFLAARYYAGLHPKISAIDVADELKIPKPIAQAAVAKKFKATTDLEVAARGKIMYDAFVINGNENQKISNDALSATRKVQFAAIEADNAKKAFEANPTYDTYADHETKRKNLEAANLEFARLYDLYLKIPYETEAHLVGGLARLVFKERSSSLPAIPVGPIITGDPL
jgi:hypothetical protein